MSTFEIGAFQEALGAGIRPNLFEVDLGSKVDGRIASFLVTAASLPGRTIGVAPAFYRGRQIKLAGDMSFGAWTTTIINDSGFTLRDAIESWMTDFIESAGAKVALANPEFAPSGYFGDLFVRQLDRAGNIIRTYKLVNAWPSDISDIALNFGDNDSISDFTCTWQYQHIIVPQMGQIAGGIGEVSTGGGAGDSSNPAD